MAIYPPSLSPNIECAAAAILKAWKGGRGVIAAIAKCNCRHEDFAAGSDPSSDIAHVIEFLHRVNNVKIRGARGFVGTSNIVWNSLPFSLHYCKNLLALWVRLDSCRILIISVMSRLRTAIRRWSVVSVRWNNRRKASSFITLCNVSMSVFCAFIIDRLTIVMQVFLSDAGSSIPVSEQQRWSSLEDVDLSFNHIDELDESVVSIDGGLFLGYYWITCRYYCTRWKGWIWAIIVSQVGSNQPFWNMAAFQIMRIGWFIGIGIYLQHLTNLTELNLGFNGIEMVDDWHAKLGNVKRLILTGNSVRSLKGSLRPPAIFPRCICLVFQACGSCILCSIWTWETTPWRRWRTCGR